MGATYPVSLSTAAEVDLRYFGRSLYRIHTRLFYGGVANEIFCYDLLCPTASTSYFAPIMRCDDRQCSVLLVLIDTCNELGPKIF